MRLQRVLLIWVVLLVIWIPACSKSEPTPGTISIPEMQKPASSATPSSGGQVATPVPPESESAYPVPGEMPSAEPYPAPVDASALLERNCTKCHTLDRVKAAKKDAAGWQATVNRMIQVNGAQVAPEDAQVLVEYLAATYH